MAPSKKKAYELEPGLNGGEIAVGDHLLTLEQGRPYETDHPDEQRALEAWPRVREAKAAK
jgi:hypothetical protein